MRKRNLQKCILTFVLLYSSSVLSDCTRGFVQADLNISPVFLSNVKNFSGSARTLSAKISCQDSTYALSVSSYSLKSSHSDKRSVGTNKNIEQKIDVVGLLRFISGEAKFGFADVGVGIGIARGKDGYDCVHRATLVDSSVYECTEKEILTLGIPIQVSASFGKYIGLGVHMSFFHGFDGTEAGSIGLSIPIGKF